MPQLFQLFSTYFFQLFFLSLLSLSFCISFHSYSKSHKFFIIKPECDTRSLYETKNKKICYDTTIFYAERMFTVLSRISVVVVVFFSFIYSPSLIRSPFLQCVIIICVFTDKTNATTLFYMQHYSPNALVSMDCNNRREWLRANVYDDLSKNSKMVECHIIAIQKILWIIFVFFNFKAV